LSIHSHYFAPFEVAIVQCSCFQWRLFVATFAAVAVIVVAVMLVVVVDDFDSVNSVVAADAAEAVASKTFVDLD
jgi:uncharacterized membrane protein